MSAELESLTCYLTSTAGNSYHGKRVTKEISQAYKREGSVCQMLRSARELHLGKHRNNVGAMRVKYEPDHLFV